MNKKRVVVTGLGVVSPLGLNLQSTWEAACAGQSGVARITHFDPSDCPVQIAAEVKGFDPGTIDGLASWNAKEARKVGRFTQLAMSAGVQAFKDSGLDLTQQNPERMGVNMGVGMGGLPEIEEVHRDYLAKGYKRITPFFITQTIPNLTSGMISIHLGLKGPNLCNATACTSSAHAIGEALEQIRRGSADVMLAGGAEAVICQMGIGGFASMRALSTLNEEPSRASRPYDKDRDGFVMGEGSAVLVLEELEHARARGARIYAELIGYGVSADAYHITTPSEGGIGGERAMKLAVQNARDYGFDIQPSLIDYVNAHGTSTPAGDAEEAAAIARFVDPKRAHVSSTKSMTGHLLGAAGAMEAIFSVKAIQDSLIPPTINLENLDPECEKLGLNFTALQSVSKPVHLALSNSFGFGGTNGSLLFSKYSQ